MSKRRGQPSSQRGVAIVLLLWMLAAMALTVSAAVHFARGDTAMADLRREEARAYWMGRGAARLALRDYMLRGRAENRDAFDSGKENIDSTVTNVLTYEWDDVKVAVELYPADGFLSLNTASVDELAVFMERVAALPPSVAVSVAMAIDEYRSVVSVSSFDALDNPGFQYVEELLSMPGVTREAYDIAKNYAHVLNSGSLNVGSAPTDLQRLIGQNAEADEAEASSSPVLEAGGDAGGAPAGVAEQWVLRVYCEFDSGAKYQQLLMLPEYNADFIRVRRPERFSVARRSQ